MPDIDDPATPATRRGVSVIPLDGPEVEWADADPMPGDQTPDEYGPGEFAVLYESEANGVVVGLWRRDYDIGDLYAKGRVVEVMLEGHVEITEPDGTVHRAGPHDTLIYDDKDEGQWRQTGPIKKLCVFIQEEGSE